MRIAIVGCGNIANLHAGILKQMGEELILAIDYKEAIAKKFAENWDMPHYTTELSEIMTLDIDCVHICTPPTKHYEQIKFALENNKHVICEKPMCLNPVETRELMDLAKDKGLITAINFNVRFHQGCQEMQKQIASPLFGKPLLIHGRYLQAFHIMPTEYSWRYQEQLSGPMRATTEIGSHWIDLVRFLTGLEITDVSAQFANFHPTRYVSDSLMYKEATSDSMLVTVKSEDAATVTFRFSNGAFGNLLLSEVSHGRHNSLSIEVTSDENSIWWDSEYPYQVNHSSSGNTTNTMTNAFGGGFPNTFQSFFCMCV